MKLSRLEMVGFKSFMNKTTVVFEDGITAVVGPNGCGKSNIIDAIFWVMGDQSPKHLRGNEMGDVIFAGSENYPQAGMSEVHLTLSTDDGVVPPQYSQFPEVTVTRRLYRTGESEYLINKTPCRLRDVLELFMDSGVGAKSYSVIEQGDIGKIVTQKPQDRRAFIEEAAGIMKFKSRKHEAELKLSATEQNLLRLNDIIVEIKRQIDSLERQAKKAERYKQIKEQIREIELTLISGQYADQSRQLKGLEATQKGEELELQTYVTDIQKKESESEILKLRLTEMEKEHQNLEQRLYQSQQKIYQMESALGLKKKEIEHWQTLKTKDEGDIQAIEAKKDQIEKSLKNVVQAFGDVVKQEGEVDEGVARHEKEVAGEIQKSLWLDKKIEEEKKELMALAADLARVNQHLIYLNEKERAVESRIEELIGEEETLEIELKKIKKEKNGVESSLSKAAADQKEIQHQKNQAELELKRLREKHGELQRLNARIQSLAEFKTEYEHRKKDSSSIRIFGIAAGSPQEFERVVSDFKKERLEGKIDEMSGFYIFVTEEGKFMSASGSLLGEQQGARAIFSELKGEKGIDLSSEMTTIEANISDLSNQIEALKIRFHESQLLQAGYEKDILKIEENMERVLGEKEGISDEKSEEIALKNRLLEEAAKGAAEKQRLEENKKAKEASIHIAETAYQKGTSETENKKKAFTGLQVTRASLKEKREALERQKEHLDLSLKGILSEIDEKGEAVRLAIERQKAVTEEIREDERLLQTLIKGLETQKGELTAFKISFDQKNLEIKMLDDDLKRLRGELHKVEAKAHDQQLKYSQCQMTIAHLCDQVRERYQVELSEIYERYEGKKLDAEDQNRLPMLKEKAANMGEVNLMAIQEFEELEKRYNTLTAQKEDLVQSMESLRKTIEKINRISRERFQETFEKVNENFKKVFPVLFGGGRAELILSDPNDLLETGIDIMAKPPGKKHQNISLLSGGEKALTAVSLIFAAFLMRPSPFCLLDEVDAPLDDVNVNRFNEMIRQMTKQSQFIVITHNKKTMEMADTLYGVTMETPGVSMMVSVKLDRAVQMAEVR